MKLHTKLSSILYLEHIKSHIIRKKIKRNKSSKIILLWIDMNFY